MRAFYLLCVTFLPSVVQAFGAAGHEIVATIAQIYLYPSTLQKILPLLPEPQHRGELAYVAAWADKIKFAYRWSSPLHYVNGKDDYPPSKCYFGEHGWMDDETNIFTAIANYTERMGDENLPTWDRSFALKFLIHFIGDLHQPLHLTGRNRGGNSDYVRFEGRKMSLHSLWDGQLIAKAIRTLPNYTHSVPSPAIESVLQGAIYDPYVRWMTYELLEQEKGWSASEVSSWLVCPQTTESQVSANFKSRPPLSGIDEQLVLSYSHVGGGTKDPYPYLPVCPYAWAEETHRSVTCPLGFPGMEEESLDTFGKPREDLPVVSEDWYKQVRGGLVLEKLLVMGGLRLAGVLNAVFGDE
ncbi:phospholipase C/P1 nuclease [Atractiella rhizophila]|nr:phospholipase C/P1 nuclease [Atractiella rhizophila]